MLFLLLSAAHADDLWSRCLTEERLTSAQADTGRALQARAFREPRKVEPDVRSLVIEAPRCPAPRLTLGAILHATGRDDEAHDVLGAASRVAAWPEVLLAHAMTGEPDPQVLERAVEANPNHNALRMRWIQSSELPSQRTGRCRKAMANEPDVELARYCLEVLDGAGYRLEAIEQAQTLITDLPELEDQLAALDADFRPADRTRRATEIRTLEDGTEEIVVYSPKAAREAITARLATVGLVDAKPINGGVRYRSEDPNQPAVRVYDDGRVEVQESGKVKRSNPQQGMFISKRKLRSKRNRVLEAIYPEVSAWRQAKALAEFQRSVLEELPPKLESLWKEGISIEGSARYETPAERRQALLAHWSSRGCDDSGRLVRQEVERYLRLEVLEAGPIPLEEIEHAEAADACKQKLKALRSDL